MDVISVDELRCQVRAFLNDFKELMGQGRYAVKDHHKTLQTLISLGLTSYQMDAVIRSIELEDYESGPNPDELRPGVFWVFGKSIDGNEIYIKLKIVTYGSRDEQAICISFHTSEYPLAYPLRSKS